LEIGQEVGFSNPWLVFQIYADQITQQCTDEVVPKWIDQLGAVDLFTYDQSKNGSSLLRFNIMTKSLFHQIQTWNFH